MVIISNGFQKFHLSVAAAEANKRGILSAFLTGAYPTAAVCKIVSLPLFRGSAKVARLMARKDEVPEELVHAFFVPEFVNIIGNWRKSDKVKVDSFISFGKAACIAVENAAKKGARIYHYRAGSGGMSVQVAKDLGMITICDHSIAHPRVLAAMVDNGGEWPSDPANSKLSLFDQYILEDIERADAVLVNSDFVKETFNYAGHTRTPVYPIYWGLDEYFLNQIPKRAQYSERPRMITIGLQRRKGGEVLVAALQHLEKEPWNLQMIGGVEPEMATRYAKFLTDSRIEKVGHVSRPELAAAMSRAEIFVFPSLAEGSARVIFEAMACGCYIITTPNSGSVVEDGIHGCLVPAGDSEALASAIVQALNNPALVAEVGSRNAELVRSHYRQTHYGDKLADLYCELLNRKYAPVSSDRHR